MIGPAVEQLGCGVLRSNSILPMSRSNFCTDVNMNPDFAEVPHLELCWKLFQWPLHLLMAGFFSPGHPQLAATDGSQPCNFEYIRLSWQAAGARCNMAHAPDLSYAWMLLKKMFIPAWCSILKYLYDGICALIPEMLKVGSLLLTVPQACKGCCGHWC